MKIAVVVVNYGTADLAIKAVQSVLDREGDAHDVLVHLVDNASPNEDAAQFEAAHVARGWGDLVRLRPQQENMGFGRGNNVVLQEILDSDDGPDYVLLLNPDARLANNVIETLAETLDTHPTAGAAGASVQTPEGDLLAAAFRFPNFISEMLRTANFGPLDKLIGPRRTSLPLNHTGGVVDWVTGAAVMLRGKALREAGIFDPTFFLYYEEVELMHRLKTHGWDSIYVPAARVIHDEGAATGGGGMRRQQPYYLYDSWRHFFAVTRGRFGAVLLALGLMPFAVLNVAHRLLRGKAPTIPKGYFKDQWRLVIWPLLTGQGTS